MLRRFSYAQYKKSFMRWLPPLRVVRFLAWFAFCVTVLHTVRVAFFVLAIFAEQSAYYPLFDPKDRWPYFVVLSDVPSLLFFSIFTIVILFWYDVHVISCPSACPNSLLHAGPRFITCIRTVNPCSGCASPVSYSTCWWWRRRLLFGYWCSHIRRQKRYATKTETLELTNSSVYCFLFRVFSVCL